MAQPFGGSINPSLGATNYNSFLQGSLAGSQMAAQGGALVGQSIAQAGQQIGSAIQTAVQQYQAKKEQKALEDGAVSALRTQISSNPELGKFLGISDTKDDKLLRSVVKTVSPTAILQINQQLTQEQEAAKKMQEAMAPVPGTWQGGQGMLRTPRPVPPSASQFLQQAAAAGVDPNMAAQYANAMSNAYKSQQMDPVDPLKDELTRARIGLVKAQTGAAGKPSTIINTGDTGKMKEEAFKKFTDTYNTDIAPLVSAQPAIDAMDVLINNMDDKGQVMTGKLANIELTAKSLLNATGLANFEDVAATQEYVANSATLVGQIIKQFGAGTGLSDADREFATKAAAGDITMDRAALKKLVAIAKKVNKQKVDMFNERVGRTFKGDDADMSWARESLLVPASKPNSGGPRIISVEEIR